VRTLEVRYNTELPEGMNPNVRALRMTLDPLEVVHRPLVLYLLTSTLPRLVGEAYLRWHGFVPCETEDGHKYWWRQGPDGA
jgi:hypothetical protein